MAMLKEINADDFRKRIGSSIKAAQENVNAADVGAVARKALDAAASGAGNVAKTIGNGAKNFDVGEAAKSVVDTAASGAANIAKVIDNVNSKVPDSRDAAGTEFIELLWFLAAADGEVTQDEKIKIAELNKDFKDVFPERGEAIEQDCLKRMEEGAREFGWLSAAKMEALNTLRELQATEQEKKMLCWNLFAVASSDEISDGEIDYIEFVSDKVGIDGAVIEELKSYSMAIVELDNAMNQLQMSNRAYKEIRPLVDELKNREQVIIESAQALIADK